MIDRDFGYDDENDLERYFEMESQEANMMGMAQLDLINTNLHHQLLSTAIGLASKDWLWKFRSQEYKMKKITSAFRHMNRLIEEAKGD